jgi:GNAT superfamily N-acetyltransferase
MKQADEITYSQTRDIPREGIVRLYRENDWSSAEKPDELYAALIDSHALVSAWQGDTLVGIGNAISDGHLVVYYPHLLVQPSLQGRGIGQAIMQRLMAKYESFHQQMLVADGAAVRFYEKCGFVRAGETVPMWIYDGDDH